MNRFVALVGALLCAVVSVSSACAAAQPGLIHFTLEQRSGDGDKIHASFRDDQTRADSNNWSTGFRPADLVGLDVAGFRAGAARPLRFAAAREAGRIDCSGHGGGGYGAGDCRFTFDPRFAQLLDSRGIRKPTQREAFGLMAVNARGELVNALAAARYPTPSIDDLTALAALGVDGPYIGGLASAGYRPASLGALIEFKALGITPAWIAGFARIGYATLPSGELVQMKALGITPDFILGFDRAGYSHLSVDKLVELKALGITPEFVRQVAGDSRNMPPVEKLVELKLFSRRR